MTFNNTYYTVLKCIKNIEMSDKSNQSENNEKPDNIPSDLDNTLIIKTNCEKHYIASVNCLKEAQINDINVKTCNVSL